MTRLIVNADDFGMTSGINRAIVQLHDRGVLTSATLMAHAAASEEAVEIARATPMLGVGCHIVLVDGSPLSARLPTLAPGGTFHPSLGRFLRELLAGRIRPDDLEREAARQITSIQNRGIVLTHVDTHKHTHMFPQVLRPVLRAAHACGISRIRNPFEPAWSISATADAPFVRRVQVRLLRRLEASFHQIVTDAGFVTTQGAVGVLATGTLDTRTLASLVNSLPGEGTFELVAHPGYNDADLARANTRLLASRDVERSALESLGSHPGLRLISFQDI